MVVQFQSQRDGVFIADLKLRRRDINCSEQGIFRSSGAEMVRFEFWFYKYFVPLGVKAGAQIDGFIFKRTLETPHSIVRAIYI